jgi:hypothetical protein
MCMGGTRQMGEATQARVETLVGGAVCGGLHGRRRQQGLCLDGSLFLCFTCVNIGGG